MLIHCIFDSRSPSGSHDDRSDEKDVFHGSASFFGHFGSFSSRSQTRADFLRSGNEIFFSIVSLGGNSKIAVQNKPAAEMVQVHRSCHRVGPNVSGYRCFSIYVL